MQASLRHRIFTEIEGNTHAQSTLFVLIFART